MGVQARLDRVEARLAERGLAVVVNGSVALAAVEPLAVDRVLEMATDELGELMEAPQKEGLAGGPMHREQGDHSVALGPPLLLVARQPAGAVEMLIEAAEAT